MTTKFNTLLSLGYDDRGRRIRKRITANSKQEFEQKIYEAKKEYEFIRNPSSVLFKDYAEKWVETYQSLKSTRTYLDSKARLKKFEPINFMEVRKIKQTDLQILINEHKEYPRTCELMKIELRQIFNAAIDDGIIANNPAKKLVIPPAEKKEKRALSILEAQAVQKVKLKPLYDFFLKTIFYCGLRPGEALGLHKSDFNIYKKELTISRALAFKDSTPYLKSTKTYVTRIIPLPDPYIAFLEAFLPTIEDNYIFMIKNEFMTRMQYLYMWKTIKKEINKEIGGDDEHNLCKDLTAYHFRHNYATLLYYSDISMKQAAKLMGHVDATMIMKVYAHIDESKENVREKLNRAISANPIEINENGALKSSQKVPLN